MSKARVMSSALALAALVLLLPAASPPAAAGPAVEAADCPWSEFTRLPGFSTFPDTNTLVYQATYSAGPAHETVITGRAPSARFWSFAVLDQARREIASLADEEIRLGPDGSYAVRIAVDCEGADNCLQLDGAPAPYAPERVFYRLYVPDVDDTGGVGLPAISYRATEGPDAAASVPVERGTCTTAYAQATAPLLPGSAVHEAQAEPSGLEPSVTDDATAEDPEIQRYQGLGANQVRRLEDAGAPPAVVAAVEDVRGEGGFGATADNAYVTFGYNVRGGDVHLRAKAPTYRAQHDVASNDAGVRDGSEQVRYWSLCTTQETRPVDCLRDEHVVLDAEGFFDVVIAPDCPVEGFANCLRAGKLGAAGGAAVGILLYRNLFSAEAFFTENGPHECPPGDAMFCGDYAPRARYVPRP